MDSSLDFDDENKYKRHRSSSTTFYFKNVVMAGDQLGSAHRLQWGKKDVCLPGVYHGSKESVGLKMPQTSGASLVPYSRGKSGSPSRPLSLSSPAEMEATRCGTRRVLLCGRTSGSFVSGRWWLLITKDPTSVGPSA